MAAFQRERSDHIPNADRKEPLRWKVRAVRWKTDEVWIFDRECKEDDGSRAAQEKPIFCRSNREGLE